MNAFDHFYFSKFIRQRYFERKIVFIITWSYLLRGHYQKSPFNQSSRTNKRYESRKSRLVIFYRVFLEILSRSAGPGYRFLQILLVYFFQFKQSWIWQIAIISWNGRDCCLSTFNKFWGKPSVANLTHRFPCVHAWTFFAFCP